jgi:dynein heavy chain
VLPYLLQVMDDNRLLTLPSNERIRLLPHMKLIFEIRDLKFATPATATRAGILYISEGKQWHNMVQVSTAASIDLSG